MILVIDKTKKNAVSVAEMFFYMGVLTKGVTISDAFSEISNAYRAIVLLSPEAYPDAEDFIRRLRSYNLTAPIFTIGETESANYRHTPMSFSRSSYAAEILSKILQYAIDNRLPMPGDYKLAGLDLSCDAQTYSYFWTPFPLTKTEAMIVKYLIRTYPRQTSAEEILKYAYRETRTPEASNVRTHISVINRKFRELTGRNLIDMRIGVGYNIITPETEAKKAKQK